MVAGQGKIFQVIYSSRSLMDPSEDAQLLEKSRANNARLGITGVLVRKGNHFMQVLQGEQLAVSKLMHRISQDPRHEDVMVFSESFEDELLFPDWSMGSRELNNQQFEALIEACQQGVTIANQMLASFMDGCWR